MSSSAFDANCLDLFNNVLTEEKDLRSFLGPENCDANDKSTSLAIKSYLKLCSVTDTKQWQVGGYRNEVLETFNNTEMTQTNHLTDQSVVINDEVFHIKNEEIEEINLDDSQSESINLPERLFESVNESKHDRKIRGRYFILFCSDLIVNPDGSTFVSMLMKKGTKRKCIYCQNRTYFQCCKCSAVTCREHASYICIECVTFSNLYQT